MQAGAERRDHVDPGSLVQILGELRQSFAVTRAHRVGGEMRAGDDLLDRAMRQQHPIGDVGNLVTALGLVHVVGGDQHREPFCRERMDLVPELAPCLGIDASCGLVEQ
jgi:hypothetical protein